MKGKNEEIIVNYHACSMTLNRIKIALYIPSHVSSRRAPIKGLSPGHYNTDFMAFAEFLALN